MLRLKDKTCLRIRFQTGFSLLELMLAVTILSVGMVIVIHSYVTSLRAVRTSSSFLAANLLLEEKIWESQEEQIRLGEIVPEEKQGEFALPFEAFSYKINFEKEQFEGQEESSPLYKSTFEVFWQEKDSQWSSSCLTYM